MILLDTSYVLAAVNPRDALHDRAVAWSNVIAEPLLVTEYVLWESVNYLSSPVDRPKAHAVADQLRSSAGIGFVEASQELLNEGLRMHAGRPDKAWSLTDCISIVLMEERSITRALAYDHHFEQAGFEALLRRDPP
ncbi:MAG TPA: PIN domain-containing protein [Pirellulales bacterium]|nr:PIN domain-containing protein [Pirellulales bacterium]